MASTILFRWIWTGGTWLIYQTSFEHDESTWLGCIRLIEDAFRNCNLALERRRSQPNGEYLVYDVFPKGRVKRSKMEALCSATSGIAAQFGFNAEMVPGAVPDGFTDSAEAAP